MVMVPYFNNMKMTLNVDDGLLASVMEYFGVANKTRAIDLALREVDRKKKLAEIGRKGLGLGAEELKNLFDADYDVLAARAAEAPAAFKTSRRKKDAADSGR